MVSSTHLLRDLAPIPDAAWKTIDDEARERLRPLLAARRLADWVGPGGWRHSARDLGRVQALDSTPTESSSARFRAARRVVQPLVEFSVDFQVGRGEIDAIQRGAASPEFDDLAVAAREAAELENRSVFHGWEEAGIAGLTARSPHQGQPLGTDCQAYPATVARAVDQLRCSGIEGPYALVIGPVGYTRIVETAEQGGHLLLDHLEHVLGGPVLWAPGVDGAVVVSKRGGDVVLDVGQDYAIGYRDHDAEAVHLYLEASFTVEVLEPDAAVTLT